MKMIIELKRGLGIEMGEEEGLMGNCEAVDKSGREQGL